MLSNAHQQEVNRLVDKLYELEVNELKNKLVTNNGDNTSENTSLRIRNFDFENKLDTTSLSALDIERECILDEYRKYLGFH